MKYEPRAEFYFKGPHALKERLRDFAERKDLNMTEIHIAALNEYLDRYDPGEMKK